jgi:hypothetical protein
MEEGRNPKEDGAQFQRSVLLFDGWMYAANVEKRQKCAPT